MFVTIAILEYLLKILQLINTHVSQKYKNILKNLTSTPQT